MKYKRLQKLFKINVENDQKKFENNLLNSKNQVSFFKYKKSKIADRNTNFQLKQADGELVKNPKMICELFLSVRTNPLSIGFHYLPNNQNYSLLQNHLWKRASLAFQN